MDELPERDDDLTAQRLTASFSTTDVEFDELVARLAHAADGRDLIDVATRQLDSPYGPLLVAVTRTGVVRVAFASEDHDVVLESLAHTISPRILEDERRTDPTVRQLSEYFDGKRTAFDVPVDLRLVRGFRRQVIERLSDIHYGTVASYGRVAELVGNPRAVRTVGSACANNPVPIVVPCHRVIRADGNLGNYLGGVDTKRSLLALEAR